jgi:Chemoreceptor zinc-binding domain
MGFFSRLFGLSDDKSPQTSILADTKDDIQFDDATSKAVLAEIDIDTAISAHENWKLRLENYLAGKSSEDLKPEVICLDDKCQLGQWLHGNGKMRLGAYPAFSLLIARHQYFHVQASSVVALQQAGKGVEAQQVLTGNYTHASKQVILLLNALKQGLTRKHSA